MSLLGDLEAYLAHLKNRQEFVGFNRLMATGLTQLMLLGVDLQSEIENMKVKVSTLVRVASVLVNNLDETRFIGAIRSFVGRNTDKETLGSTARETKDGQAFTVSLTQKTRKVDGVDARAIHWLAACSELASLGLMDEGAGLSVSLPKPANDVSAWLARFKVDSLKSAPEK